jgi:cysteine-S-conjugate beta-lyase
MLYNFNEPIDRAGTNTVKYDLRKALFGREDVIPMWVADMDFAVPPFVQEAVMKRAAHPIYGYTIIPESFYSALISWQKRRHNWVLAKESVFFSPGVVTGLNMIVQAFTEPGDKIIVQPPVYFPFFSAVKKNGRELMYNELIHKEGIYSMDQQDLEKKMKAGAKMMILCNPHNPVGRSWTRAELEWLGEKSIEHGVMIVSDEIHCDLVFPSNRHIPFATLSEDIASRTITCIAPSKTFNLAGLFTSSILITDEKLREKFKAFQERLHLSPNIFGITAAEAAYSQGDEWLGQLMDYLARNAEVTREFILEKMPEIRVSPLEATYLMWLDFKSWHFPPAELRKMLIEKAGIGFVDGREFGPGGDGFQRMNIGCPQATVLEVLERLFSLRKSVTTF